MSTGVWAYLNAETKLPVPGKVARVPRVPTNSNHAQVLMLLRCLRQSSHLTHHQRYHFRHSYGYCLQMNLSCYDGFPPHVQTLGRQCHELVGLGRHGPHPTRLQAEKQLYLALFYRVTVVNESCETIQTVAWQPGEHHAEDMCCKLSGEHGHAPWLSFFRH